MRPSSPAKILMTADTIGGVWTYSLELIRRLRDHQIEIALATMGEPLTAAQWRETAAIDGLEIFESRFQLEWMREPWRDVDRASAWLLELESTLHPDIVHLNGYAHGALAWKAPALVVAHSCVLSWWQAVKGQAAPAEWEEYHDRVRQGLCRASAVVAPTAAMLDSLSTHYGFSGPGTVIHNARTLRVQSYEKERLILAAGRLGDEAKNIATLGAAAKGLPWRVAVAGRIADPSGEQPFPDGLEQLGYLEPQELASWFGRASIYCLPARYEPFGLSILEAALSGCALVLGDIPTLRELWSDAAIFVDPEDPAKLHSALWSPIEDPTGLRALGEAARARAARFTPERMTEQYLALYCSLLAPRTAVPA